MSFIRTKKIKGKEYAYIVENRWKKRGNRVKQKTKKYLGRVYRFDRTNMMDFYGFYNISDVEEYLKNKNKEDIINDLIKLELFNYGFQEKDGIWQKESVFFDFRNKKVYNEKNKSIALAFNEGFLSDFTIKRILNFRAEIEEDGYILAKLFVEAGIAVPKEVFVGYYKKTGSF